MNYRTIAETIVSELNHTLLSVSDQKAREFVDLVDSADEIFCAGAGRSGFQSYVVGETCTPNITENGVLVICSG